jgi:hypothetical protein
MTKVLMIIFSVVTLTAFGQVENYKAFRRADYPGSKYSIKSDTFLFNNFNIELIQTKLLDYKTYDSSATFCRIWLTVKNGNTIVDKLFFNDCESVGGCSGIYASNEQTRKNYFILSKFGDYDGRILIIDTSGKIKSFIGGHYYLSVDNRYLFSPYSSDLSGLTVYDLLKNQVLFSADTIRTYLADFYYYDNKYFAIVSEDVKEIDQTDIVTYDFKTNKLIESTVDDTYIVKSKKLKGHNIFTHGPCDCGRGKK